MKLDHVKVEETKLGDHYDPDAKAVRLLPQHSNGRSLAALVIAAHETGHAMQDATEYRPLQGAHAARQAGDLDREGRRCGDAGRPHHVVLAKSPQVLLIELAAGALILGMPISMHAYTLPVELDASFRRALPVLKAGKYIPTATCPPPASSCAPPPSPTSPRPP